MATYGRDRSGALVVSQHEAEVAVKVTGRLDRTLGDQLVEVVEAALAVQTPVVLDVVAVRGWTWAGVDALGACIDLGAIVPACRWDPILH